MADGIGTLQLKGTALVEEWQTRVDAVARQIAAHDRELERARGRRKTLRAVIIGASVLAGVAIALWHVPVGIVVGIVGTVVAFLVAKVPQPHFVGQERVEFLRALLREVAGVAPRSKVTLTAQLDARRGLPQVALPSGSGDARISDQRADAWLTGSLLSIPGLKVFWQAAESRTVTLVRRRVVRRRTKIKTKGKFALATRLSVRLDADRTLFTASNPPAKSGTPAQGTIEVRAVPHGWSIRARRDVVVKTALRSTDVAESLAALRSEGRKDCFGVPAAALLALMKLCEGHLAPAAKAGAQ